MKKTFAVSIFSRAIAPRLNMHSTKGICDMAEKWANTSPRSYGTDISILAHNLNWEVLHGHLDWALLMHVYGFSLFFFLLSFYTFFSFLNLRSLISSRPFMATINGFLCLLGSSRALSLFIDPYGLTHIMPKAIGSILWDVGFPAVLSPFCLIELALLQLTKLKVGPKMLMKKSFLSTMISVHFSSVFAVNIATIFQDYYVFAKYALQVMFALWGIMLCFNFIFCAHHLRQVIRTVPDVYFERGPINMQNQGIMQLAVLAPYNNLASSVAAAIVPTLLAPKISITDENEQTLTYVSTADGFTLAVLGDAAPEAGPSTAESREQRAEAEETESLCANPESDGDPQQAAISHIAVPTHAPPESHNATKICTEVNHVLYVTIATAVFGVVLCVFEILQIIASLHPYTTFLMGPKCAIWSWFVFQTGCRTLEFVMGCAMAAVTKLHVVQPAVSFPAFTQPALLYM